jgi:HWE histidine kinase
VVETGESAHFKDYVATLDRWFEVNAYRSGPGRFALLFLDMTERKAADEKRTLLLREVDHRAKNALAVVQTVFRLTTVEDIPSFIKTVDGRIGALARAHTLLASHQWPGSRLRDGVLARNRMWAPCPSVRSARLKTR